MTIVSSLTELLSASGDAAYDWDVKSDIVQWFGAWERIFGDETPPANAKELYAAVHHEDHARVFSHDTETIDRKYRLKKPDGQYLWVHERGAVERRGGIIIRQCGLLRLTDRPVEFAFQSDIYDHDLLTGTYNRHHILNRIADAMENGPSCGAYLVLGIDKMSFVNGAVGMQAGDALLRGVAERIGQLIPARATLARVGGDMFGVLLGPSGDMPDMAEKLLQSFRDNPVVTGATPLHITVSIGGVRLPIASRSATEAMIFAEQALHDAHQRGRNLFAEYQDSPERTHGNRQFLELGERIKHAFKRDGFRLAYQPVIETATGKAVFYEALVRMFDDAGNPIPAMSFVPAIEQLGLAPELDRRVLELAIDELRAHPNLKLAVNVSGLTASQSEWTDYMKLMLAGRRDIAERLIIEITETAAIVDVDATRHFIEQLVALGGQASLDDFGAGFTSIRHLRSLSLSIMKIDKDLLYNLLTHAGQQHLVKALIDLARGLGLRVVAEGVETAEVVEWMKRAGVDMMQGYYFGKPSFERPWASASGASAISIKPAANKDSKPSVSAAV